VDQVFDAHPGINMLIGRNGAGKTNFLDAVYYAALGRSYFTARDKDVVRSGAEFMRLDYVFKTRDKSLSVIFKLSSQKGKSVTVNDAVIHRMSQYAGKIRIVMMAPQDAFLLLTGNTERRRWLDQLLCQSDPEYAIALRSYNQLLKRRNEYLKKTEKSQLSDELLDTYWSQMKVPAEYIFNVRADLLKNFGDQVSYYYQLLSNAGEKVRIDYHSILQNHKWMDCIAEFRKQEFFTGSTAQGIHKDKIEFEIDGQNLKHYGSQGQIKSFIIALKMAEYEFLKEHDEPPILLIDDVFAKLDNSRIDRFFKILDELKDTQIFVSDTDRTRMRDLLKKLTIDGDIHEVTTGKIRRLDEEE
jgi:DNA replication and repair protein RecF